MADREGDARALSYDPGRDAALRYPGWVIRHRPIGVPEVLDLRRRVILLDDSGTWHQKRSSLAHALAHLDLGHVVIGGHLGDLQERDAELLAARRLMPLAALADAIRWCREPRWDDVAHELGVDARMLRARLDHFHPSETHALRALLATHHADAVA